MFVSYNGIYFFLNKKWRKKEVNTDEEAGRLGMAQVHVGRSSSFEL